MLSGLPVGGMQLGEPRVLGCARRGCRSGGSAVGAAGSAGVSGRVRASSAVLVVGCKLAPRRVGEPSSNNACRTRRCTIFSIRARQL